MACIVALQTEQLERATFHMAVERQRRGWDEWRCAQLAATFGRITSKRLASRADHVLNERLTSPAAAFFRWWTRSTHRVCARAEAGLDVVYAARVHAVRASDFSQIASFLALTAYDVFLTTHYSLPSANCILRNACSCTATFQRPATYDPLPRSPTLHY